MSIADLSAGPISVIAKWLTIREIARFGLINKNTKKVINDRIYPLYFPKLQSCEDQIIRRQVHRDYICNSCAKISSLTDVHFRGDIVVRYCDECVDKYVMACEKCNNFRHEWHLAVNNYDRTDATIMCGDDTECGKGNNPDKEYGAFHEIMVKRPNDILACGDQNVYLLSGWPTAPNSYFVHDCKDIVTFEGTMGSQWQVRPDVSAALKATGVFDSPETEIGFVLGLPYVMNNGIEPIMQLCKDQMEKPLHDKIIAAIDERNVNYEKR